MPLDPLRDRAHRFAQLHRRVGVAGRAHVAASEPELLEGGEHLLQGEAHDAPHGPREGGVHDRDAAGAEAVLARDRRRVDRGHPVLREAGGDRVGVLVRVDEDPSAGLQAADDGGADERRVQHHHMVRLVDEVPVRDQGVVPAAERLDGSTRALGRVQAESLDRLPPEEA
jgi:hypothetical protein